MFGKLIKYNLKAIFKSILPFIIALLASVIFFNLTDYEITYVFDDNGHVINEIYPEFRSFLHGIFNLTIYCSLILLIATTVRAIWHEFQTNFYSDRAYLTHTLPISRRALWNSQICTVLITFATIAIILTLSCLILTLTRHGTQMLESFGLIGGCSHCVGDYYYVEPLSLSFYLSYGFIFFSQFVFLALCGMTGSVLKNRFNKNIALLAGFCIYIIGQFILINFFLSSDLSGAFHSYPGIMTPSVTIDYSPIITALLIISVFYTSYSLILYFVDQKLLKHGINLD